MPMREGRELLGRPLSRRESEALAMYALFPLYKVVAYHMGIQEHTVRDHFWAARAKLGVPTNIDAYRKMGASRVVTVAREVIYERDGGRCHACGTRVPRDAFDLDHLVPLAAGGNHVPENLAVACVKCNRGRRRFAQLRLVG